MKKEDVRFSFDNISWLKKKQKNNAIEKNSEQAQVALLKQLNIQLILTRKLTEKSLTYDKDKKQYVSRDNQRIDKQSAFDIKKSVFVPQKKLDENKEQDKQSSSKLSSSIKNVGMGVAVAAAITAYAPMMWPFFKGMLKQMLPTFITEAAANISETAEKFIGLFKKDGVARNAVESFEESTEQFIKLLSDLNTITPKDGKELEQEAEEIQKQIQKLTKETNTLSISSEFDNVSEHYEDLKKLKENQDEIDEKTKEFNDEPVLERSSDAVPSQNREQSQQPVPRRSSDAVPSQNRAQPPQPVLERSSDAVPNQNKTKPDIVQPETKNVVSQQSPTNTQPIPIANNRQQSTPAKPTPSATQQPIQPPVNTSTASSMSDGANKPQTNASAKISSSYGWRTLHGERQFHAGVDISGGQGAPIFVTVPVDILNKRFDPKGYGNFFDVKFPDGTFGRFAHMLNIKFQAGDKVPPNSIVGLMGGQTGTEGAGSSTGPHLHYEHRRINSLGGANNQDDSIDPMLGGINYISIGRPDSVAIGQEIHNRSISSYQEKNTPTIRNVVIGVNTTKTVGLQTNA